MRVSGARGRRAFGAALALCLAHGLAGCALSTRIEVAHSELAPEVDYAWFATFAGELRDVYSTQDEQVVLSVRFAPNFVAKFKVFLVEWIAPNGNVYYHVPTQTAFASHESLISTMKIRGQGAARLPGSWRVRLSLDGRRLAEERFTITSPKQAAAAKSLEERCTPVFADNGDRIGRECLPATARDGCTTVFADNGDIIGRECPAPGEAAPCTPIFADNGDIIGRECPAGAGDPPES